MISKGCSEAAVEVLDILDNTIPEDVSKIPIAFIEFLKSIASKDYVPNLDHSKPMNEMDIKEETKGILGTIYRKWWSIKEEQLPQYDVDDIFAKRKQERNIKEATVQEMDNVQETQMIEHKEPLFKRIINKILSLFGK